MRHGKKFNHLGRTASHRKAMLSNMASSLILQKRINTTVAKAKALKKYVEPLLTKAKDDTTHSRRTVFSYLQNKDSVNELFGDVATKIASRPGGYTRILKTGSRLGDNADMCIIELVDYNEAMLQEAESKKSKTRRSRRGKAKPKAEAATAEAPVEEAVAEVAEDVKEEAATEEVVEAVEEQAEAAAETTEEVVEETPAAETETPAVEEAKEEEPATETDEAPAAEATEEAPEEEKKESDEDAEKKEDK